MGVLIVNYLYPTEKEEFEREMYLSSLSLKRKESDRKKRLRNRKVMAQGAAKFCNVIW